MTILLIPQKVAHNPRHRTMKTYDKYLYIYIYIYIYINLTLFNPQLYFSFSAT